MRYKILKSNTKLYFVTSVIVKHKIIFLQDDIAKIPLHSLAWLREQGYWKLYGFCLLPNHIHFIVKLENASTINEPVFKFHSFTAHEIIKYLKETGNQTLLTFFQKNAKEAKTDRDHLLWNNCLIRNIETEFVLRGLLEYTHNNPLSKKWKLADSRDEYRYSSACYFDKGMKPIIAVDNVNELF